MATTPTERLNALCKRCGIHYAAFAGRWYFDGTGPIEREPTRDELIRSNTHGPYNGVKATLAAVANYAEGLQLGKEG